MLRKTQNLELCFGTNVGTNQAKIAKIFSSDVLGSCVLSAIQFKANKSNWRREERLIGSRAVQMLRDLRRRARGPVHHVAAANARAEVRARLHNWWI